MLKKFYIGFCLFVFVQQEYHAMETNTNDTDEKWYQFLESEFKNGECLQYHVRAFLNNFFRKWCGVYKRVKLSYGEFFYGTVNGIGWYPQFLNFHKHFRIGFFELTYNFITLVFYFFRYICTKKSKQEWQSETLISLFKGFNFSIINFKIYNDLIKLNFINPIFILICIFEKDYYTYTFYSENVEKKDYGQILFFGKDLQPLKETFYLVKKIWDSQDENISNNLGIEHLILLFNLILPEIYIDINLFLKNT